MSLSWDERWQQKIHDPTPAPDSWLANRQGLLTTGTALDLACGRGRNSIFLGTLGYRVLALDSSTAALELLNASTSGKNLPIETLLHNLDSELPPFPEKVDLILCFYFLQRSLFPEIKTKIAPGGLFIGRSFCQREASPEICDIIYEPGELFKLFNGWEIIDYEEGVESAQRGGTLAGIIARKPLS